MAEAKKARAVGVNHIALEVGDIDEALAFYGRLFDFKLRGRSNDAALSISVTSSLPCKKGGASLPMRVVISDWSSMTRRRSAIAWPPRASMCCQVDFSISSTPGQPDRDRRLREHSV